MYNNAVLCEQVLRVMISHKKQKEESVTAEIAILAISRCFGLPIVPKDFKKYLSEIIKELFTESDPTQKASFSLGDLAFELVIALTAREFTYPDTADTVISAEPILYCYGKFEESYIDLRRSAKETLDLNLD